MSDDIKELYKKVMVPAPRPELPPEPRFPEPTIYPRQPAYTGPKARSMTFVDGENLAIRFKSLLEQSGFEEAPEDVVYERDVFMWSWRLHDSRLQNIRTYYYTSVQGDDPKLQAVQEALEEAGVEAPRVFKKPRDRRSKRVDISLATDMLTHAHRGNYEVAVLYAGDQDYVPLVEAVKEEGARVYVRFFKDQGLSHDLYMAADEFTDITGKLLFP